jgi:hypothetical protein
MRVSAQFIHQYGFADPQFLGTASYFTCQLDPSARIGADPLAEWRFIFLYRNPIWGYLLFLSTLQIKQICTTSDCQKPPRIMLLQLSMVSSVRLHTHPHSLVGNDAHDIKTPPATATSRNPCPCVSASARVSGLKPATFTAASRVR